MVHLEKCAVLQLRANFLFREWNLKAEVSSSQKVIISNKSFVGKSLNNNYLKQATRRVSEMDLRHREWEKEAVMELAELSKNTRHRG